MFLKYQLSLGLAVLSLFALSYPLKPLTSLGPLLNPFKGVWRHKPLQIPAEIRLKGLSAPVEVVVDPSGVPHLFAANREDLFLVQGWWSASQRLFQMDLSSRPGSGRLSELMGEATREYDEFFIKLGQRASSETALEAVREDPLTQIAVEAFSKGVNAYIKATATEGLPPEYVLLGIKPEPWSPLKTANFLKTMSFNLAGRSYDLHLTRHLQKLGRAKTEELFPDALPWHKSERFVFSHSQHQSPQPKVPAAQFEDFVSGIKTWPKFLQPFATNGSNNFAVAPQKSENGFSILANDTHLGLSLPSVWLEMHLEAPGYSVYGATFPASPGVILGFNQKLAWGVTNGTSDVADWYEIEFKDETSLEYWLGDEWVSAEVVEEPLIVKSSGRQPVQVIKTAFGFVMHREGKRALTVDWTAHRKSNELKTFLSLGESETLEECHQAISTYQTPSQNFLCVTSSEISLTHQGLFPKRNSGQGKYVLPARAENRWTEWLTNQELPRAINPPEGFLRSANNHVLESYESELGWDYDESYRARRIEEVLKQKTKHRPEDLIDLQNDETDLFAAEILPLLLKNLDESQLKEIDKNTLVPLLDFLQSWRFVADVKGLEATVFYAWWTEVENRLYAKQLGVREGNYYPRRQWTEGLLKLCDQTSEASLCDWIPSLEASSNQKLKTLVTLSFNEALKKLNQRFGPMGPSWSWGMARPTELRHIARLPGFGSQPLEMGGTRYSPNANHGRQGATWKLVVEMSDPPRAWSMINGGQSGHPFSADYELFVNDWREGKMKPVFFDSDIEKLRSLSGAKVYRFEPFINEEKS